MPISVTEPIGAALQRTKRILFQPFDIGKWFLLGFCAFLANLGEGGGFNGFNNFPGPGGGGGSGGGPSRGPTPDQMWREFIQWVQSNLPIIIIVGILALLVIVGLSVLFAWIKCRGKFMFLDGLALNRGAVVEPWKEFRAEGNSLLGFSIVLAIISLVCSVAIIGLAIVIALPDIRTQKFGDAAILAIVLGGILLLLQAIVLGGINWLLQSFVVPAMYLRRTGVMAAWTIVRAEILAGHGGTVFLFLLMRIVLVIAIGILTILGTCATCCLPVIPYLGTVILLPLFVFSRCNTLCFIEQFGPQWMVFRTMGDARCRWCGYDLRGVPGSMLCPECGGLVSPLAATPAPMQYGWTDPNQPPPPPPMPPSPPYPGAS